MEGFRRGFANSGQNLYTVDVRGLLDGSTAFISLSFGWLPQGHGWGLTVQAISNGDASLALEKDTHGEAAIFFSGFTVVDNQRAVAAGGWGFLVTMTNDAIQADPGGRDASPDAVDGLHEISNVMGKAIFGGVEGLNDCDNVKSLAIWPHSFAYGIPYWLLPYKDGVLSDYYCITILPSIQSLAAAEPIPESPHVLLVGSDDGGSKFGLSSVPMQESCQRIGLYFPGRVNMLVGAMATPRRVIDSVEEVDLLHVAAHGLQDILVPMFHCVFLAAEEDGDGRLFAHQILGCDLSNVKVVTLNACEGLMTRYDGCDELLGIGPAFIRAGAGAVMASHVGDSPRGGYVSLREFLPCGVTRFSGTPSILYGTAGNSD